MNGLRILGIDTSGKMAAAAVYDTEQVCFLAQEAVYTKRTHSQVILPLAERLLSDAGLTIHDIEGFAVAKGPGSYTGLRIGIAAVQAMGFARSIPCIGVSTLCGLAWQNLAWDGTICAVMAARKSLYYVGFYESDTSKVTAIEPDGMLEQVDICSKLQKKQKSVLFVGDGAEAFRKYAFAVVAPAFGRLQNGTGICFAAANASAWETPEQLQPAYLQPVKAEKDLQQKRQ